MRIRSKINRVVYKGIVKPICFRFDPEKVHDFFVNSGEFIGKFKLTRGATSFVFKYKNKKLKQKILGIEFENPIGLSAGFDYNARLTGILPDVGYGFASVGSITYNSMKGNPRPMLGRLPKSKSLLVNKGLKNIGAKNIIRNLGNKKFRIPIGVSIAKTNCKLTADEKEGIKDYVSSLKLFEKTEIASYYEINISCPNAFGGEPFTTPDKLEKLLKEIDKLKLKRAAFLKMPIDLSLNETEKLFDVASKHNVQGVIIGNLTKNRENEKFDEKEIKNAGKGAFSGKPTEEKNNALIRLAYKKYGRRFITIGCGGVFNAEDAYKKIKLGASLIQMISGMIYEGPGVIGEINHDIVKLMEKDGYNNISEAIGKGE